MPANKTIPLDRPRILLYCDDVEFRPSKTYSTAMIRRVLEEAGFHVGFEIRLLSGAGPEPKLNEELLYQYNEVWFFLRETKEAHKLTEPEEKELLRWMNDGGGVLITGDHAISVLGQTGDSTDPNHDAWFGLGRAVGKRIPRAGKLRVWEGGPIASTEKDDVVNDSTVPDRRPKTSTEDLEKDSIPQRLLFPNRKRVHPIFLDDKGELVDLLPDHNHEGAVVIPEKRKPPEWPASGPAPEAIAYSLDWMRLATFACMVEWNGHKADGAGRILADTTWHHYVDLNLARFENTALWPTIKQLYTNMVWRLAPRKLEKPLVKEALEWVRTYPGLDLDAETGEVRVRARSLLARRLPATLYHGLIDDVLAEGGADELLHAAPGLLDHLVFVLLRGEQADPMERLHDLLKGSGFDVMAIEHYLAVTRHLEHHNLVEVSALPRPAPRSSVLERALASYKRSSEALSSTLSIRGSRK